MKSTVPFLAPVFRLLLFCKSPEDAEASPGGVAYPDEVRRVTAKTLLAAEHYLQTNLFVNLSPSNQLNQPDKTRLELD
jgi:hypothetical protein